MGKSSFILYVPVDQLVGINTCIYAGVKFVDVSGSIGEMDGEVVCRTHRLGLDPEYIFLPSGSEWKPNGNGMIAKSNPAIVWINNYSFNNRILGVQYQILHRSCYSYHNFFILGTLVLVKEEVPELYFFRTSYRGSNAARGKLIEELVRRCAVCIYEGTASPAYGLRGLLSSAQSEKRQVRSIIEGHGRKAALCLYLLHQRQRGNNVNCK